MRRLALLSAAAAVLIASAGTAYACSNSRNVRYYFSDQRPIRNGDLSMLRVSIDSQDVREIGTVRARLLGSASILSDDAHVRIRLDEGAQVTNCIHLGPIEGPVFVLGRLQRSPGGELTLVATATRASPDLSRPRHDPGYYESYIDPAFSASEERRRQEHDDRP